MHEKTLSRFLQWTRNDDFGQISTVWMYSKIMIANSIDEKMLAELENLKMASGVSIFLSTRKVNFYMIYAH